MCGCGGEGCLMCLPVTPYNGSSGWSGSTASQDRADREDASGKTTERQMRIVQSLRNVGQAGVTWKELGEAYGWHHGQASGALSVLHKEGRIARLTERRHKCSVYVLNENVNGRDTEAHGSTKRRYSEGEVARLVADAYEQGLADGRTA